MDISTPPKLRLACPQAKTELSKQVPQVYGVKCW